MKNFEKIKRTLVKLEPKLKVEIVEQLNKVWVLGINDWDFYRSQKFRDAVKKLNKLITKEKWVIAYRLKEKKK